MIITAEHEIDLDRIMENIGNEIARTIDEMEYIDWYSLTEASQKDLYKRIAEYILTEWA